MEAYNRFNFVIYKWLRVFGLAQGHDILRPEWSKWSFYTLLSCITAISIPFMYMWTMYNYSGDLAMKAFGYLGIGYQVRVTLWHTQNTKHKTITVSQPHELYKHWNLYLRLQIAVKTLFPFIARQSINESIDRLKRIYQPNLQTTENLAIFDRFTRILRTCAKLIASNYMMCVVSFYASPAIIYFVTGSADPIMPLFLPGTSPDSVRGYIISTIYHIYAIFCAGCVYIFFDVAFAVQILHVILMTDLLMNKVRAINDMAADGKRNCSLQVLINFRNVLMLHNEMLS